MSPQARGYGASHIARRRELAPLVAAGLVDCARCGERIEKGEPWHLGHDDENRHLYNGPEHVRCNCATKSRKVRRVSRHW